MKVRNVFKMFVVSCLFLFVLAGTSYALSAPTDLKQFSVANSTETPLSVDQWTKVNQIKLEAIKPGGGFFGFPPVVTVTRLQFEIYKKTGIFGDELYTTIDNLPSSMIPELQSTTITLPDGSYTWRVRAVSSPDLQESNWVGYPSGFLQNDFNVDTTPPTGSVSINNGAAYTNSSNVTLNLQANDAGVGNTRLQMLYYRECPPGAYCILPFYESFNTPVNNVPLMAGEGVRKIFARYSDRLGNATSSPLEDTIIVDKTKPSVVSTSPADTATNSPINNNVSAVLNESTIDPANINSTTFQLTGGGPIAGAVTFDSATKTVVFDPNTDLANSTTYTVKITTGLKDLAGNTMATDKIWTFTTVAAPVVNNPGTQPITIQATGLTLKASPKTIKAGKAVNVKGQLKNASGKPVAGKKVKIKANGKTIKVVTTKSGGVFTFKHKPKKTTKYSASFAGDGSYKAASSKAVKVIVKKVKKKKKSKKKK